MDERDSQFSAVSVTRLLRDKNASSDTLCKLARVFSNQEWSKKVFLPNYNSVLLEWLLDRFSDPSQKSKNFRLSSYAWTLFKNLDKGSIYDTQDSRIYSIVKLLVCDVLGLFEEEIDYKLSPCISGLTDFLSVPGLDPSFQESCELLVNLINLHNHTTALYSDLEHCSPSIYEAIDLYIKQASSKAKLLYLDLDITRHFVLSITKPFVRLCFLDQRNELDKGRHVRLALVNLFVQVIFNPSSLSEKIADIPNWLRDLYALSKEFGPPVLSILISLYESMLGHLPLTDLEKIYQIPISAALDMNLPGVAVTCMQLAKHDGLEIPVADIENLMKQFLSGSSREDSGQLTLILKGILDLEPSIAFNNAEKIVEKVSIVRFLRSDLPIDTYRAFSEAYGSQRDLLSYWKFVDAFVSNIAVTSLESVCLKITKANFTNYPLSQHEALLEKCAMEIATPISYDDPNAPFSCAKSLFGGIALVSLLDTASRPLSKRQNDALLEMLKASMEWDDKIAESRVWQLRCSILMLNDFSWQNKGKLEKTAQRIYENACAIFTSDNRPLGCDSDKETDVYQSSQCVFRLLETGLIHQAEKYFKHLFLFLDDVNPPSVHEFRNTEIESMPEPENVGTYIAMNVCRRWLHVAEKHLSPQRITELFYSLVGGDFSGLRSILTSVISSDYFLELPQITRCMFSCLFRILKTEDPEVLGATEILTDTLRTLQRIPSSCLNSAEKRLLLSRCFQDERKVAIAIVSNEQCDIESRHPYLLSVHNQYISEISSTMERYLDEDVVVPDINSKESLFNSVDGYFPHIRRIRCDYPVILGKCYINLLRSKPAHEANEMALATLEELLSDHLHPVDANDAEERRYAVGIVFFSAAVILAITRLKNAPQSIQDQLRISWDRVLSLISELDSSLSNLNEERSTFLKAVFELLNKFNAFKRPPSVIDWRKTCLLINSRLEAHNREVMKTNNYESIDVTWACNLFIARCFSFFYEFEDNESAINWESENLIARAIVLFKKIDKYYDELAIINESIKDFVFQLASKYPSAFIKLYSKTCSTAALGCNASMDILAIMTPNFDKETMGSEQVSKLLCEFIEMLYQCVKVDEAIEVPESVSGRCFQDHDAIYKFTQTCKGLHILENIFVTKPWAVTQYTLEMGISFISFASYQFKDRDSYSLSESRSSFQAIIKSMMKLLSAVLLFHRHRFNGRYFLIVHAMQTLADLVFWVAIEDANDKNNPLYQAWLSIEEGRYKPKSSSKVTAEMVTAEYNRLLSTLCQPSSQKRKRKSIDSNLVSAASTERKIMARNVIPYVFLHFLKLMIEYPVIGGHLRKELTTGIHAMFDCLCTGGSHLDQHISRRGSSGLGTSQELKMIYASMDSQSRPLFKSLYQDYEQFGEWREDIY